MFKVEQRYCRDLMSRITFHRKTTKSQEYKVMGNDSPMVILYRTTSCVVAPFLKQRHVADDPDLICLYTHVVTQG